jgi:predicted 3-demethylubiquinone-9 3-methyltransferase (glyoxalase superfamily)
MSQKIMPCLWFNDQAEEAAKLYTSLFKNSQILNTVRYGEGPAQASGRPKGSVMTVNFNIAGYEILGLNGGPHFQFTPAASFMVACDSEKEIDMLWSGLSKGGLARMELGKYPFAEKYGWCEDRFGLSWQLIYDNDSVMEHKISPAFLFVQKQTGKAEAAMKFYTSLFSDSKIEMIERNDSGKVILHARFQLAGQNFIAFESPIEHDFYFNPALSLIVKCENQKEIDQYWNALSAHKESEACGWLKDKFDISWQIVPATMAKMLTDNDLARGERVMTEVMKMTKIDVSTLERAFAPLS